MPKVDEMFIKNNSEFNNRYFLRDESRKEELRSALNYLGNNRYNAKSIYDIAEEVKNRLGRKVSVGAPLNLRFYKNPNEFLTFSSVMCNAADKGYLNFQPRTIAKLEIPEKLMYVYDPEFVEYLQKEAHEKNPKFKEMEALVNDTKKEKKLMAMFMELRSELYDMTKIQTMNPKTFLDSCRMYLKNGPVNTSKHIEFYTEWCAANQTRKV
jgi:hypothetical protein